MKKVDIFNIPKKDLPLIVLEDNSKNFFSKAIRWFARTKWPHGMVMIEPGWVANQAEIYKKTPISRYAKKGFSLKFRKPKMTPAQKKKFNSFVRYELKEKVKYDYLGIFGQLLKIKWIQIPFRNYCWEAVCRPLRYVGFKVPLRPSNLDKALGRNKIKVYGYYKKGD